LHLECFCVPDFLRDPWRVLLYTFFVDETNRTRNDGEFFIFGGLLLRTENTQALNLDILGLRHEFGLGDESHLKFSTKFQRLNVTSEEFNQLRLRILQACANRGGRFIVYVVSHGVARNITNVETHRRGLNALATRYFDILESLDTWGWMLADKDNDIFPNIVRLNTQGLQLSSRRIKVSERIPVFGAVDSQSSHICSAVDIMVGAFRYSVNYASGFQPNKFKEQHAREWLKGLIPLLPMDVRGSLNFEHGNLMLRPYRINLPRYQQSYFGLKSGLASLLL
jgi:hypothetical protein